MLRKGDSVELVDNYSKSLQIHRKNLSTIKYIPIGTSGFVVSLRKLNKSTPIQYLIKFSGYSGPRHCEINQIKMKTIKVKFKNMPFEYQRSIVVYGGEEGIVNWTDIEGWICEDSEDWTDVNKVQILINDYCKVYADRKFEIGFVSVDDVKKKIMKNGISDHDFDDFDEYHEWYYDGTDHGDSVFPIVVSNHRDYIEDGWHRFHSYVDKGIKEIPYVKYL